MIATSSFEGRIRLLLVMIAALVGIMCPQSHLEASDGVSLDDLPDSAAKSLLVSVCASCHTVSTTLNVRKTRDEWEDSLYDMLSRGAQIYPEDLDSLLDYLSANLGPEVQ